jgi:hypothetical protein
VKKTKVSANKPEAIGTKKTARKADKNLEKEKYHGS